MRKFLFIIGLVIFSVNVLNAQNLQKLNYITSGYYQLVYEADIAYLEGNNNLAFEKLQKAEECCPLINQPQYQEMELYCSLLLQNKQFEKAVAYMDTLANKYGQFPVRILVDILKNNTLQKKLLKQIPDFYKSKVLDLLNKSNEFYYSHQHDSIINVLYEICVDDQRVRTDENSNNYEMMHRTDSINYTRIFQIINTFGFPNMRLYGYKNSRIDSKIGALFIHFAMYDDFPDIMLQFVREGKCDPFLYATIIDKQTMIKSFIERRSVSYLYAVYANVQDDQIIDIEHLDERRMAIGLPTRAMDEKRNNMLMQEIIY